MSSGRIFFISWVAGAWKNTVIKELIKDDSLNLKLSISSKTRELRKGEISGVDYIKMTEEEFKKSIENWEFLEYNYIHNQAYYWTRYKDVIDDWINVGKNVIKEIDPLIIPKIIEEKKIDRDSFIYIFLDIPLEMIKQRMFERWEDVSWDNYKLRIESAKKEKELMYLADYVIDSTKSKEEVLSEVKSIIINNISNLK